jgi:hypothetical protein
MLDPYAFTDYTCRQGAEAIAAEVRSYWTSQGYLGVQTWVEGKHRKHGGASHRDIVWCVRSNLVNGLPPL